VASSFQGAGTSDRGWRGRLCNLGLIAGELTGRAAPGTAFPLGTRPGLPHDEGHAFSHLFTSMFSTGRDVTLIGNIWFFWIFGTTSKIR